MSIENRLKDLEAFKKQVQSGMMPQRTALGPGALQQHAIRSKSINASLMDVDTLASVASSTGDLTVSGSISVGSGGGITLGSNGVLTIGSGGKIKWGSAAQHYIDDTNIVFQNLDENSDSKILFYSSPTATRRSAFRGYFGAGGSGDPDYPVARMEALDETDGGTGLSAWVGIGADFDTNLAQVNLVVRNASGVESGSLDVNTSGQVHARVTTGGSFAVIDHSAPRTMLEMFPGGNFVWNFADAAGSTEFRTYRSSGVFAFGWRSNGVLLTGLNDSGGGAGAYVRRIPIVYNVSGTPTTGYLRIYAD